MLMSIITILIILMMIPMVLVIFKIGNKHDTDGASTDDKVNKAYDFAPLSVMTRLSSNSCNKRFAKLNA